MKGPFSCLNGSPLRDHVGAIGASRDSYESVLRYALARRQFGTPIASFQLTQQKLVDRCWRSRRGCWSRCRTGRLKDGGTLRPEQISFGKLDNVREAIAIRPGPPGRSGRQRRDLDHSPLRHGDNLESVRSYEGTDEVPRLIMGRAITGIPAFV